MDARSQPHRACSWWRSSPRAWIVVLGVGTGFAAVAADVPEEPRTFTPGELSIGEPIPLPLGPSATTPAGPPPGNDPRAGLSAPSAVLVPGSGWLGLAVAESTVPGRWRIEEVAPQGPAARAGIVVGDELRAVNGVSLASAADVSQALTGIAAGQDVRVVVARSDQVNDVVLRAEPRPAARPQEPSRFAAAPAPATDAATSAVGPAAAPTPAPAFLPPGTAAPAPGPAPVATTPAAPSWQASTTSPVAAPAADAPVSRFGPPPAVASAAAPAPAALPPNAAALAASPPAGTSGGRTALGVRTVPIDPATQARFNLREPSGAYVIGVVEDLPAAKAGVPPGSVIVALGEQPVRSPAELTRLVTSGPRDRPVSVQFVLPGGEAKRAAVVLQALDVPLERALTGDGMTSAAPPALAPAPARWAERPVLDEAALRSEIRALRGRLERLERLLDRSPRLGRER